MEPNLLLGSLDFRENKNSAWGAGATAHFPPLDGTLFSSVHGFPRLAGHFFSSESS